MPRHSLRQLHDTTISIFSSGDALGAGLDWVDKVLPHFTDACRHAVTDRSSEASLDAWDEWLNGPKVDGIREAGEPDAFVWRRTWLRTLIEAVRALRNEDAYDDAGKRSAVAEKLYVRAGEPFSPFPKAFWCDLVDSLSGTSNASDAPLKPVLVAFPLVLAERMIIAGDTIDVLLADFTLYPTEYGGGQAYLDPDQVALRCIDPAFAAVFGDASAVIAERTAPQELPSVRVGLAARRPEHEVFLRKLVLRGSSGGGAMAAGLYGIHRGGAAIDRGQAFSFALAGNGKTTPDGRCHAVGGAYEKVRGCAKDNIRRLVVSEEQGSQVSFYGNLQSVTITGASTVSEVLELIDTAPAPPQPTLPPMTPDDGGVVPLGSRLYVERKSDNAFIEALEQRPMIVLVKGPRQIGKTSLLVRGVDKMRRTDVKLVYVDLRSVEREKLKTLKDFFMALGRIFARELNLNVRMEDIYDERDGPNKNFENFLFRHALDTPVIWFMDETDRLFDYDFFTDVFSLMRSWHNRRPIQPELANLTLVLCYATETHLMIEDAYQSPFNVGVKVELDDFSLHQIAGLNDRLGEPLRTDEELNQFYSLVGGHPHLVCRGLSWLAHERKSLSEFAAKACLDQGPLGAHLRHLHPLMHNPELVGVVHDVLRKTPCNNNDAFLRLRSAGVLIGDDCSNVSMRCAIYADYLRQHLPPLPDAQPERNGRKPSWWRMLRRDK